MARVKWKAVDGFPMRDWRGVVPTLAQLGNLREHQDAAYKRAIEIVDGVVDDRVTVAEVTPGGGKTKLASIFANVLIRAGFVDRVVSVVPVGTLRDQTVKGFFDHERGLLLKIVSCANNVSSRTIFDNAGYVTTYASVARGMGRNHLRALHGQRFLLVLDEVHHLADEEGRGWVPGIRSLVDAAKHTLLMSGDLGRHDELPIPFVPYTEGREPIRHIRYTRKAALDERAIIPLSIVLQDGDTEYSVNGVRHEVTLSTAPAKKERKALRCAVELDEYRDRLLTMGVDSWLQYRNNYYKSQLIVVCDRQAAAKEIARGLKAAHPAFDVTLAISDEPTARHSLRRFREKMTDILVTVQMASEGLDAPWATHLVLLSKVRTFPWLNQVTARITRFNTECGLPWDKQAAAVFAPGDTSLRAFVEQLNKEQDARYKLQADRLTSTRGPGIRRSTFVPESAEPTNIDYGGELGMYPTEIQDEMRRLRRKYPHLQQASNDEVSSLAQELLDRGAA